MGRARRQPELTRTPQGLRWVRTGGAGRLAPRTSCTARTGYAYRPRAYRVPRHPRCRTCTVRCFNPQVELRGAHDAHGEATARAASLAAELEARRAEAEGLRASASAREAEGLYLRNVVKKYMETEQHEALFPVIATCMHFSQASQVSK